MSFILNLQDADTGPTGMVQPMWSHTGSVVFCISSWSLITC
jgi:hypothetical protein